MRYGNAPQIIAGIPKDPSACISQRDHEIGCSEEKSGHILLVENCAKARQVLLCHPCKLSFRGWATVGVCLSTTKQKPYALALERILQPRLSRALYKRRGSRQGWDARFCVSVRGWAARQSPTQPKKGTLTVLPQSREKALPASRASPETVSTAVINTSRNMNIRVTGGICSANTSK